MIDPIATRSSADDPTTESGHDADAEERQAMTWVDAIYDVAHNTAIGSRYDRSAVDSTVRSAATTTHRPPDQAPTSWVHDIIVSAIENALRGCPPKYSDQDLTDRCERDHGDDLLYSGRNWYVWRDQWLLDSTNEAGRLMQQFCRRLSQNVDDAGIARRIAGRGVRRARGVGYRPDVAWHS